MTHLLVAEFASAHIMNRAAQSAAAKGYAAEDALTPFAVHEVFEHLTPRQKRPVGWTMVVAGACAASLAYAMQVFSATVDYPLISGGRPFNTWQVFLLVTFEASILAAGIAGFIALLRDCRLPALHHPLFELIAVERATQDRFFLVFGAAEDKRAEYRQVVDDLRPLSLHEIAL